MPLTNTQYNLIMRRYEARQLENQRILQERIRDAYLQCPRLKEVDDRISSVSLSRARLLLDGDTSALSALKSELGDLIQEKTRLLNHMGYPANYLEPPYQCPDCRDTGYIDSQKCHCFRQAALDLVYNQANMYTILQQENFGTFSYDYYSDKPEDRDSVTGLTSCQCAHAAVEKCQTFVRNFDAAFENLLIYGTTGIGKTFLTNCITKELLDTEHSVLYFTSFELFKALEQAAFHGTEDGESYYDLFQCDLLIIDDLGTELTNSFTNSQLFVCLNERILRKKSTIISTNLSLSQLADLYSERIFSRLTSHYTMIKMFGTDIRRQKRLMGRSSPRGRGILV